MPANPPPAQLLPCPFGHAFDPKYPASPVQRLPFRHKMPDSFALLCRCGARGPEAETPDAAAAAWNTRAPTPERGLIVQADRERASLYAWAEGDVGTQQLRYDIRHGKRDNHPLVEEFAAHRLAHSPESRELASFVEALAEALWPFTILNSSDEHTAITVRSDDIRIARAAHKAALHALSASPEGEG